MELPTHYTVVTGTGQAESPLMAFDAALTQAGVAQFNLVRVSSILPPGAREAPEVTLPPGSLLPIAYGGLESRARGRRLTAGVGIGLPDREGAVGVIVECHGELTAGAARRLLQEMLTDACRRRGIGLQARTLRVATTEVGSGAASAFAGVALWRPPT